MHAIKKAARRSAWYNHHDEPEGVTNFNPFGRYHSKPRHATDDVENQLTVAETVSDARPVTEYARNEENQRNSAPPDRRSYTLPPAASLSSPTNDAERMRSFASTAAGPSTTIASTMSDTESKRNETSSDIPIGETTLSQPSDDANVPRRRRFFKGFKKPTSPDSEKSNASKDHGRHKYPPPSVASQIKVVFLSWINLLLFLVPVGIALNYTNVDRKIVFVMNFLAIIPLAAILSFATEELAMYIGEVLGGLLNATFGNAVELIVSIIALVQQKVYIVQTSLIGSMLSNLLLVLGMCFFFGGINRSEQYFNITVAQTAASMLALAIGSLIIPTAYAFFTPGDGDDGVTPTSRGTAVLLLVTYACYLLFQLRTHVDLYNVPSQKVPTTGPLARKEDVQAANDTRRTVAQLGANIATAAGGQVITPQEKAEIDGDDEKDEEVPQLTLVGAVVTLVIATVFIALCAEFMVDSIDDLTQSVSPEFIGLILLPIVGNAAEHATSVTVAIKDKMDLSIGVAAGSSLQIALLVIPIMIMLNWWGVGSPADLNLAFDGFQVIVLFIAVIVVNYVIQDGKSNWMEGVLLQVTYLIIAVAAWFYPTTQDVAG